MKKAVILARVSSRKNETTNESRQDTERQSADLLKLANAMNADVVRKFEEYESGGKDNSDRPILQECLTYCKDNDVKLLLVTEISRLGRQVWEVLESIKFCNDNGIGVYMQDKGFCTLNDDGTINPMSAMFVSLMGSCAELERENIKNRLQSGYKQFRAKGGKVGRKVGCKVFDVTWRDKYAEVIKHLKKGYSVRVVAKLHNISPTTAQKIKRRIEEE